MITAGSSSARSAVSSTGWAPPSSCSNSPGVTITHSAPASSLPPSAASANPFQATSTLAPESDRWYATSRDLSSGFIGTTTAPSRSAPKYTIGKYGTFGSCIPTRSPGSTPFDFSIPAARATAASRTWYVSTTSSSLSAGRSPASWAAAASSSAKFVIGPNDDRRAPWGRRAPVNPWGLGQSGNAVARLVAAVAATPVRDRRERGHHRAHYGRRGKRRP